MFTVKYVFFLFAVIFFLLLFEPLALTSISSPVLDTGWVTGTFTRHSQNIRQYTFIDKAIGRITRVNATPNHRFYVKNKHRFIAAYDLSVADRLVTAVGQEVRLLCLGKRKKQCSHSFHPKELTQVFNLEINNQHIYFVGENAIEVHNVYQCPQCSFLYKKKYVFLHHLKTFHSIDNPSKCFMCYENFSNNNLLQQHFQDDHGIVIKRKMTHLRCPECIDYSTWEEKQFFRHIINCHPWSRYKYYMNQYQRWYDRKYSIAIRVEHTYPEHGYRASVSEHTRTGQSSGSPAASPQESVSQSARTDRSGTGLSNGLSDISDSTTL